MSILPLPTEFHALIEIVRNSSPTSAEFRDASLQLCNKVVKILPKSRTGRGKICSGCRFKMFNRCIKCPQCNLSVAVRHYGPARPPTPPSLLENDCISCKSNVKTEEATRLSCTHLYHTSCLRKLVIDFKQTSCSHCPDVKIPDISLGSI